ncbi:hypothetical protein BWO91_17690 [Plantibacter flavus]|nr:hypothetical protein BWO91_17690 [Plantibacter flavus]
MFGQNGHTGAQGEKFFLDGLKRSGIADFADVRHGVRIPSSPADGQPIQTDVDFTISNGDRLVLVDVKRWSTGAAYWSIPWLNLPMKNRRPLLKEHSRSVRSIGELVTAYRSRQWALSRNMEWALTRYRDALPSVHVSAMVVFVPTSKGGMPESVSWLLWPGLIRSYRADQSYGEIQHRLGHSSKPLARTTALLDRLQISE